MKALVSAGGKTVQHNGVEYAEAGIQFAGDQGVAIQYESGGTTFVTGGNLDGVYQDHIFEKEVHAIDRVEGGE